MKFRIKIFATALTIVGVFGCNGKLDRSDKFGKVPIFEVATKGEQTSLFEIWKEVGGSVPVAGETLLIRVFENGTVEFDQEIKRRREKSPPIFDFFVQRNCPSLLPEMAFKELKSKLEGLSDGRIKKEYRYPGNIFLDVKEDFTILHRKDGSNDKIIIHGSDIFSDESSFKAAYPLPLRDLVMSVGSIREELVELQDNEDRSGRVGKARKSNPDSILEIWKDEKRSNGIEGDILLFRLNQDGTVEFDRQIERIRKLVPYEDVFVQRRCSPPVSQVDFSILISLINNLAGNSSNDEYISVDSLFDVRAKLTIVLNNNGLSRKLTIVENGFTDGSLDQSRLLSSLHELVAKVYSMKEDLRKVQKQEEDRIPISDAVPIEPAKIE